MFSGPIFRKVVSCGLRLLLLSAMPAWAAGGDWFPRVWRTDDGLPDNGISGIAQTPDGFLWVGTQGGLMRFDGARFQEFSPANMPDVPNRVVRTLTLDRAGRLWLAMDRGAVICAEPGQVRVFTHKDGLPDAIGKVMVEDAEGAIWIAYNGDQNLSRIKDGVVTRFDPNKGSPPGRGWSWLARDAKGQLWYAKANRIGVFRDGRFQLVLTLDESSGRIAAARGGGIWICTETRLLKYEEGGTLQEHGRLPKPEGGKLPQAGVGPGILFEDRTGAVWIGTDLAYGLFRYDGSCFEAVPTSHPVITCFMEDREGNLWVGTIGGLNRLRPRVLELLDATEHRSEAVRSATEDAAGDLWVVTRDGLLMHRQNTNWINITSGRDWPGGRATCVTTDRDGALWIGTRSHGLYRLQNNQFTAWSVNEGLASESIRSCLATSRGDIWIGTDGIRRLQRLSNGKFQTFDMPSDARAIRAMAEDASGTVWTATAEGQLLRIRGDEVVNVSTNHLPHIISIRCLYATADGSLWLGYADRQGLARLKDGNYFRFTSAQGLAEDYVSQIVDDEQGWLWLAGNRTFSRVQLQQLHDVAEGRARHVRSIVFGRGEGLPGLQANYNNHPASFQGRDGRPRIATRTGIAVIHTENIRDNPDPPPVLVERLTVDGHTVGLYDSRSPLHEENAGGALDLRNPGRELRLPPEHRKIEFEFAALSFTAPENVQFRYRLEGLDEDWTEGGTEHVASYSRLPAGNYRFNVIACNNSGVWNKVGAAVGFSVLPFFWETWWFRLAALSMFTLSVIAIVRYVSFRRLRWQLRILEQQAALDKERTRIARDLHDDLGGSLTQVALLLDMNQPASSAPAETDGTLRRCSGIVRQVVKSVDEIIWAINPRNDTVRYLIDYISQFAVEFLHAARIRCRVELPDHLPDQPVSPEVRHNLFLVLKEALNNIVRHAAASEVWLRIHTTGDRIEITIEDDGKGFERPPDNSSADGLRNMRQRMEEIGGRFAIESRPAGGTRIALLYASSRNGSGG